MYIASVLGLWQQQALIHEAWILCLSENYNRACLRPIQFFLPLSITHIRKKYQALPHIWGRIAMCLLGYYVLTLGSAMYLLATLVLLLSPPFLYRSQVVELLRRYSQHWCKWGSFKEKFNQT